MFCKMRALKSYFCNWLRKNWPTLTSFPHLPITKHWLSPLFVPPTRISEKNSPPLICLVWNLGPPFTKGGRKLCYLLIRTCACAYQGVRNVSFSENFGHVLNEWSLKYNTIQKRISGVFGSSIQEWTE